MDFLLAALIQKCYDIYIVYGGIVNTDYLEEICFGVNMFLKD